MPQMPDAIDDQSRRGFESKRNLNSPQASKSIPIYFVQVVSGCWKGRNIAYGKDNSGEEMIALLRAG